MTWHKKLATAVLTTVLTAGFALGAVTTAEAAVATQQLCNSKNSEAEWDWQIPGGLKYYLDPGDCATVPLGTRVFILSASYRVGYDKKPYSECRAGYQNFIPYQKAKIIYFRTYVKANCVPDPIVIVG